MTDKTQPDPRPERPALAEAIRASQLPKRKPTDADGVPATTLPRTKAQREALRIARGLDE